MVNWQTYLSLHQCEKIVLILKSFSFLRVARPPSHEKIAENLYPIFDRDVSERKRGFHRRLVMRRNNS